jgi:hypothetical protein
MAQNRERPPGEDLHADEQIIDLPPREALSIVDPGIFSLAPPLGRIADPPPATDAGPDTATPAT